MEIVCFVVVFELQIKFYKYALLFCSVSLCLFAFLISVPCVFSFVFSFRAIAAVNFISHTFANFQNQLYTISVVLFFLLLYVLNIENDGTNQLAFGNVKNAFFLFDLSKCVCVCWCGCMCVRFVDISGCRCHCRCRCQWCHCGCCQRFGSSVTKSNVYLLFRLRAQYLKYDKLWTILH